MTRIESKERVISQNQSALFSFLCNFNNFENLMPEKVSNWTSTNETCYFNIAGIANLGMKITEKKQPSFIKIIDDGKVPFSFQFFIYIRENDLQSTSVKLVFDAELNAMLKMVAVKPLTQFLEDLLDHLEEIKF